MKIYQLENRKWNGNSKNISDSDPCPYGWIRCDIEPDSIGLSFISKQLGWEISQNQINIESARLSSLYEAAMKQQTDTCDSNFFGLLMAIGTLCKGTGQEVPYKATSCINWLETLWTDYHTRKANGSTDYDFSMYGNCPFSFLEVRAES